MIEWFFEVTIQDSPIHGKGRFALEDISEGDTVLCIHGNIYKNENNSYVNHSKTNNLDWDGYKGWKANRTILTGEELTMNYNQWVDISHLHWAN